MPRLAGLAALLCALVAPSAQEALAQAFPSKPVKLIVALAPGGPNDAVARIFADTLSAIVNQPVVVENHPGAGGTTGASLVAKAPADGYTLLVGGAFNLAIAPAMMSKMPYDPEKDFAPIGAIARAPYAFAVRRDVPVSTLAELVAYAKANPGRLTYGSSGVGSNSNLAVELLKASAGIDILHVPYKGSALAVAGLVGGQTDIVCVDLALLEPHVKAGTLRFVAAVGEQRSRMAPEVPTAVEQGFPGLVLEPWYGLVAPAGIPAEVREKLAAAYSQAMRTPELRQRLEQQGYEVIVDSPSSFRAMLHSDIEKYARIVQSAGIPREP